jgi:4-amino-4-deoxy-L-arabinose transferase-like glycosyltransferase
LSIDELSVKDSRELLKPTDPQTPLNESRGPQLRQLEIAFWLLAIVLGFFHAWKDHHYLGNADAMSYLDIAEAYRHRDWQTAVNSYWSPLYSWIIALALQIVRPSSYWKFALLHVVNFAIYVFALGAFGFLIREIVRRQRAQQSETLAVKLVALPGWSLLALGYALFIWSSLFLVTVSLESPDMLVAAFVYLASGLLLRIRRQPFSWWPFFLLGIALGLGYLAKSVMLPLALVFITAAALSIGNLRQALPRIFVTSVLFVLIAGPWVLAISRSKGRLTTGESGRLNYFWVTNGTYFPHWRGEQPNTGTAAHPTRKIFDSPPAFEFATPVGGTYPIWYDPTYWHEGIVSHFELRQQLRIFVEGAKRYYELFYIWGVQYGLFIGLVCFYLMGHRARLVLKDLRREWSLIVPAIAGIGMYSLINVQRRYVAPFVVLVWLALFLATRLHQLPGSERLIRSIALALVISICFTTVASSGREAIVALGSVTTGEDPSLHEQWQVSEGLREIGLAPGDQVAFIGDSTRAFWAHLLGGRIVAEIRKDKISDFWEANSRLKSDIIKAFAGAGAKAVVAEKPPPGLDLTGWQKIRNTDYYAYIVTPSP